MFEQFELCQVSRSSPSLLMSGANHAFILLLQIFYEEVKFFVTLLQVLLSCTAADITGLAIGTRASIQARFIGQEKYFFQCQDRFCLGGVNFRVYYRFKVLCKIDFGLGIDSLISIWISLNNHFTQIAARLFK